MTPMIDIVFQLNIFFLFTFKIVLPEGDFNIRMPSAAAARADRDQRVAAHDAGDEGRPRRRAGRPAAGRPLVRQRPDAFAQLHQQIRGMVNDAGGPGTARDLEVEIDADYDLNYEYVMRAITAITGYIENGEPHKLIERVKFTPPKKSEEQGAESTE